MRKNIYFSNYVNEEKILPNPNNTDDENQMYRYSLRIPFKDAEIRSGSKAIVIMKNPSKAGRKDTLRNIKLSDDTIYRVLDYLYKHELNFSEVIVLNLFALYASVFDDTVTDELIYGKNNMEQNNQVIMDTLKGLNEGDRIIAAWGSYPKRKNFRNQYRQRISEVRDLLCHVQLWRVGDLVRDGEHKFPQHGLQWFDFEKMERIDDVEDTLLNEMLPI
jgi:hypothetical protein